MRVPIYPSDLNSKYSFKRIAKKLHQDWPGSVPIQLSFAKELLSQAFGYRDYHDLRLTSEALKQSESRLTCEEARACVLRMIITSIGAQVGDSAYTASVALVDSLPMFVLEAFPDAPRSKKVKRRLATNLGLRVRREPAIITPDELAIVERMLREKGEARDILLFELLCLPLHPVSILSMTGTDVPDHGRQKSRWREQSHVIPIPATINDQLKSYLVENHISRGDFVFSLGRVHSHPMPPYHFKRKIESWLREAGIAKASVSATTIRRSYAIRTFNDTKLPNSDFVGSVSGHFNEQTLRNYINQSGIPTE